MSPALGRFIDACLDYLEAEDEGANPPVPSIADLSPEDQRRGYQWLKRLADTRKLIHSSGFMYEAPTE